MRVCDSLKALDKVSMLSLTHEVWYIFCIDPYRNSYKVQRPHMFCLNTPMCFNLLSKLFMGTLVIVVV